MALPTKHIIHQRRVLAMLGKTALTAARQQVLGRTSKSTVLPAIPGPEQVVVIPPLPRELIRDYVRHCGGDAGGYRETVPAHLFPQWGFPLAAKTLTGLPYPLFRVLNGGCRLEINGPLPQGEPLHVTARLENIDDNGRRAVLHQRVQTGTTAQPDAVVGHLYAIVPLGGKTAADKTAADKTAAGKTNADKTAADKTAADKTAVDKTAAGKTAAGKTAADKTTADKTSDNIQAEKKPKARVPANARELAYWRIDADAGLAFAMLTGDFNPVHWIKPYAKAFGFRSTILHGFATMARTVEGLNRYLFSGSTTSLSMIDVQFTRPLTLPASVGLYVTDDDQVFVGDAPSGPAYLVGKFERSALNTRRES